MDIKKLLKEYEEISFDSMEDETGRQEIVEGYWDKYEDDDELGLYIMNDRFMYDKYLAPAIEKVYLGQEDEVDWMKIAIEGARRYRREIGQSLGLDGEGYKKTGEYIKDLCKDRAEDRKRHEKTEDFKPAKFTQAKYKEIKAKKFEVQSLKEEVAEKITFKLGDADVEVTNDTKETFTAAEILKVIEDKNPAIFWNDADCYHYIMDFSFEKNGKKYWIESKNIEGDFSKFELNIYEGLNESIGDLVKKLNNFGNIEIGILSENFKSAEIEKAKYDKTKIVEPKVDGNGKKAEKELKESDSRYPNTQDELEQIKSSLKKYFKSDANDKSVTVKELIKTFSLYQYDIEDVIDAAQEDGYEVKDDVIYRKELKEEWYEGELAQIGAITERPTKKYKIYQNKGGTIVLTTKELNTNWALMGEEDDFIDAQNFISDNFVDNHLGYDKTLLNDFDAKHSIPLDGAEEDANADSYIWDMSSDYADSLKESRADKIRKGINKRVVREAKTDGAKTIEKYPIASIKTLSDGVYIQLKPEFNDVSLTKLFKILELGGTIDSKKFWERLAFFKSGRIEVKRNGSVDVLEFYPNKWEDKNFKIVTKAGKFIDDTFHAYDLTYKENSLNEVKKETAVEPSVQKQIKSLLADITAETEEEKEEADKLADEATKSNQKLKNWKKAKGLDKKDESLNEDDTYQVVVGICGDENSMQVISIEDNEDDAIERAKYEYTHSDLDEATCVEVVWVENGETIYYLDKSCEDKLSESLNEEVVAKFDNGKHEIVKCDKGYYNRYNIKEGKACFTTRCVESLPTALGALKKRYPNAEEVIEK